MVTLLAILVFSPLLGIIVLAFLNSSNEKGLKAIGFLATLPALVLSLIAFIVYQQSDKVTQFTGSARWITLGNPSMLQGTPQINIGFDLGVNGISVTLLTLAAFVVTLATAASTKIHKDWKSYFILLLLSEIGILGVFAAQNLLVFFIFLEVIIVPTFFLIAKWGFEDSRRAGYHYLIFNGLGSAVVLITFIAIFMKTGTFNITQIQHILQTDNTISGSFKMEALIALLIGFGVKLPIFPLHSWMVKVNAEAPTPIVMIESGILLKVGAYGFIMFGLGFFPDQFKHIAVFIAVLGIINILYGAFVAFVQDDFKRVLAFSSVSHMGIVLLGLAALNFAGIQGAVFQLVSHGFISALMFFMVGVYVERTGTTELRSLSGFAKAMPIASGFLLAGGLALLGLPAMSGFISEFMAFLGAFNSIPGLAAVGTLGVILAAVYVLRAVLKITFGALSFHKPLYDLNWLEGLTASLMILLIILIGVYPNVLANPLHATIQMLSMGIGG